MKERPIIFSGESVGAILKGRKTQTRRVIKPQPKIENGWFDWSGRRPKAKSCTGAAGSSPPDPNIIAYQCPYGKVGDKLWVREAVWLHKDKDRMPVGDWWNLARYYDVDLTHSQKEKGQWLRNWYDYRSARFMNKVFARIWLEITNVRVERVQDISPVDVVAEGILEEEGNGLALQDKFWTLWDLLNAKRRYGWDTNPFVWVIEFKRVD